MIDIARPLMSVVIPSYNHARYLGKALQSVLDQTYSNWEAIVIDNHSTDNTDDVMASFTDFRITYLKIHNKGVIAASRNAGIQAAKGEWIAFLDSDDWWTADKLQVCLEHINAKVDFIYHDLEIVTGQSRLFQRKKIKTWQVKSPVLMDLLLNGNSIVNSSVLVRRKLLEQIGGIDEDVAMIAAEDYNTWLRIAKFTDKFIYLPRRLGFYLIHTQNISQKDTSLSERRAVAEFLPALDEKQILRIEACFKYAEGRFNYLSRNYPKAKQAFLFSIKYGFFALRIKAFINLLKLMMRIVFNKNDNK
jgi:glycosyltransferase involved in cell wall biosynthesis